MTYSSVQNIAKKHKYHAYLAHPVQLLQANDYERRLNFIAHCMVKIDDDTEFLKRILWTDEAKFHNNGQVNHHNNHYWSDLNPHWMNETNRQVRWGINVWCGITDEYLIGPYFFEENLNGNKYLDFLKNDLPILLENIPLQHRLNLIWQQDGAPAHNTLAVRAYLNKVYGNNWFGTHSPIIQWPARSPDLSALEFFLWGYLKNEVYKDEVKSVDELKQKIKDSCKKIKTSIIKKVTSTRY